MPEPNLPTGSPGVNANWYLRNEEEKKKVAERKRKEEEARRKAEAEARKPGAKKPTKPNYGIPLPIDAFRAATKPDKRDNPVVGTLKSLGRTADAAVTTTVEKLVEGAAETALFGAALQQKAADATGVTKVYEALNLPITELPKQWNPLEEEYKAWRLNLPRPEQATPYEQMGADIVAFAFTTLQIARKLPQTGLVALTKGKGPVRRIAAGVAADAPAGAIADFLLAKKGDGNLANMVDLLPFGDQALKDKLKLGLAENEDDNALTYKAKATATGLIGGTALGALGGLFQMRRATQAFLRMGMPPEEAIQRGVAQGAIDLKKTQTAEARLANKEWPQAVQAQFTELETKRVQAEARISQLDEQIKAKSGTPAPQQGASGAQPAQPPTPKPEAPAGAPPPPPVSPELKAAEERFNTLLAASEPDKAEFEAAADELDRLRTQEKDKLLDLLPPTKEAELDPDEASLQAEMENLNKILQEMDQLEAEIATPTNLLEPHEKVTYGDADPGPQAAADQAKLETRIPKAAQRPDIPPAMAKADATVPIFGQSRRIHTDASMKNMATGEGVTRQTMKTVAATFKDATLSRIARNARTSTNALLRLASDAVVAFRGPEAQALDADEFFEFLRKQDLLYKRIGDSTVEGDQELLNPVGIVALKTMTTDTANQINQLAKDIVRLDLDKKLPGNQADRLIDRIVVLHDLHSMSAQIDGTQLRSYQEVLDARDPAKGTKTSRKQKMGSLSKESKEYDRINKKRRDELKEWAAEAKRAFRAGDHPTHARRLQDIANALVLQGGDPLKQVQVTDLIRRGLWQNSFTSMYNSMLSGAKTLQRAISGNASSILTTPLSVGLNGAMKGDLTLVRAAFGAYHGIFGSIGDALKVAHDTIRLNEGLHADPKYITESIADNSKMDAMREAIELTRGTPQYSVGQDYTLRLLESLVKFNKSVVGSYPERLMLGIDDFSKVISGRAKLSMDASLEALRDGGPNFQARYEAYKAARINPDFSFKHEADIDYINMSTFQADPGGFINNMSAAMDKLPILRLVVPFVKTPANVLTYQAELFPYVNQLSKRYRDVMAITPDHPDFDPVLRAEYEGRQAVGAVFFTGAVAAAWAGNMTGNGPPPGVERELWLKNNRPKSIRTPWGWVSYEPIDPLQVYFALAADVVMLGQMGHIDEAERIRDQIGFAIGMSVTDRSMLQGLAGLGAFLNLKADGALDQAQTGLWSMANNFLPLSGLRREMANAFEPARREIDDHLQKQLATSWVGFSQANPPKVDPLTGEAFDNLSGGIWNAFSPFRITTDKHPPGSKEERAQIIAQELADAGWDSSSLTTETAGGEKLLPDERSAFATALYGVNLPGRLTSLFEDNPYYRTAVDGWKATGDSSTAKGKRHWDMIQGVISQSKKEAFARMLSDNPALAKRQHLRLLRNEMDAQGRSSESALLQQQIDDLIKVSQ